MTHAPTLREAYRAAQVARTTQGPADAALPYEALGQVAQLAYLINVYACGPTTTQTENILCAYAIGAWIAAEGGTPPDYDAEAAQLALGARFTASDILNYTLWLLSLTKTCIQAAYLSDDTARYDIPSESQRRALQGVYTVAQSGSNKARAAL